jgi:hypothetical protein
LGTGLDWIPDNFQKVKKIYQKFTPNQLRACKRVLREGLVIHEMSKIKKNRRVERLSGGRI